MVRRFGRGIGDAVAKAKANASQAIPELIRIASNRQFSENTKKKHECDAKKSVKDR